MSGPFILFGPFIAAPLIEEALKPTGIYIILLRWPWALLGRLHTALLTATGGTLLRPDRKLHLRHVL